MDMEFKRFCNALHTACNYIGAYAGDVLIDLPYAWEQYQNGEWPVFFIRKTGSDLINRYEDILKQDNKPHSFKDCIEYAKRSLGVDFAMEITPHLVKLTNISLEKWDLMNLKGHLECINIEVEICDEV